MRAGHIIVEGPPVEVLTESMLAEVFGSAARVITDPVSGSPLEVPIGAYSAPG